MAELCSDKPSLSFWVSEINPDNATRVDWKQIVLSDFVFSQKLKLSHGLEIPRVYDSTHSQTVELGEAGGRVSFYFWSQNFKSFKLPKRLAPAITGSSNLNSRCENCLIYTKISWKFPKGIQLIIPNDVIWFPVWCFMSARMSGLWVDVWVNAWSSGDVSELDIVQVHACMLTGSVDRGMISVWYPVCLDWWFLRVFTLRLDILVSIVFIIIQWVYSKLLIQP